MKTNLGSILTSLPSPDQSSLECIVDWAKSKATGSVFVSTKEQLPNVFGLFPSPFKKEVPMFREAIMNHLARIRGRELIGIGMPNLKINPDFSHVYKAMGINSMGLGMELSWAFHVDIYPDDICPRFFILTTSILPHLIRDLTEKEDCKFVDNDWAIWLDNWLKNIMQSHKYIDARMMTDIDIFKDPNPQQVAEETTKVVVVKKTKAKK